MIIPRNSNTMDKVTPGTPALIGVVSGEALHFDYPGSDTLLRSCDSHDFRVPQLYIANSSPVLGELIRGVLDTVDVANGEEKEPLPMVELPETGAIVYSLLTFIFPVAPVLPSTTENTMKLLAVAQKYQMESVMTHVRSAIFRQDPPFIHPETSLHVYSLAQEYELHEEALLAARSTLRLPTVMEDLGDKTDFMPGAYLLELWKYHESVKEELASSLLEFRKFGIPHIVQAGEPSCRSTPPHTSNPILQWLDGYIESLAQTPHLFDLAEFEHARAQHIKGRSCSCADISSQTIRAFWEDLTAVVNGAMEKADSTLALVNEDPTSENDPPFVPLCLDLPDANIIIRSSDQVDFHLHKSLLVLSSPSFKSLLSPQPHVGEFIDGLPVVQLPEDADLVNSLVSLLYPIPSVIPSSYEKVFALLAACQKYDMASIQSHIRAEVIRGTFPSPVGIEAFRAYAITNNLGLIPEMESAARVTLSYPMTFESLGEVLQSFTGRALCDLVRYRKRCRDNVVSCLDSFLGVRSRSEIWEGCNHRHGSDPNNARWPHNFFTSKSDELKKSFIRAVFSPSNILEEYLEAFKNDRSTNCNSYFRAHTAEGAAFCRELQDELAQALDKKTAPASTGNSTPHKVPVSSNAKRTKQRKK
jgi:hypothetical protein